jgi:hypothetical protein
VEPTTPIPVVLRPVRLRFLFDPKTDRELAALDRDNPSLARWLRKCRTARPYGHVFMELKCGHTVCRPRGPRPTVFVKLPCEMCSRREAEYAARFARGKEQRRQRRRPDHGDEDEE